MPPAQFASLVRTRYDCWGRTIRQLEIKID